MSTNDNNSRLLFTSIDSTANNNNNNVGDKFLNNFLNVYDDRFVTIQANDPTTNVTSLKNGIESSNGANNNFYDYLVQLIGELRQNETNNFDSESGGFLLDPQLLTINGAEGGGQDVDNVPFPYLMDSANFKYSPRELAEIIYYILIFTFGVPLNLLALNRNVGRIRNLTAYAKGSRRSRVRVEDTKNLSLLMLNLNIADLMALLIYIPTQIIWRLTVKWHGGQLLCLLTKFLHQLIFHLCSYTICSIAGMKFIKVYHRKDPAFIAPVKMMLWLTWSWSILCSLPNLFVWNVLEPWDDWEQCTTRFIAAEYLELDGSIFLDHRFRFAYHMSGVISVFWLPLCIITLLYAYIFIELRRLSSNAKSLRLKNSSAAAAAPGGVNNLNINIRSHLSQSMFSFTAPVPSTAAGAADADNFVVPPARSQFSPVRKYHRNNHSAAITPKHVLQNMNLSTPTNPPQFRDRSVTYSNHLSPSSFYGDSSHAVSFPPTSNTQNNNLSPLISNQQTRRFSEEEQQNEKETYEMEQQQQQQSSFKTIGINNSDGGTAVSQKHRENPKQKPPIFMLRHNNRQTHQSHSMTNLQLTLVNNLLQQHPQTSLLLSDRSQNQQTSDSLPNISLCTKVGGISPNHANNKWRGKLSKSDVFSQTGLLVLVYLACWLPYFIGSLVLPSQLKILGVLIGMNAAVDPIIYAFKSET